MKPMMGSCLKAKGRVFERAHLSCFRRANKHYKPFSLWKLNIQIEAKSWPTSKPDGQTRLEPLKGEGLEMDNQQHDHNTGLNGENSSDPTKRHTVTTRLSSPLPAVPETCKPGPSRSHWFCCYHFCPRPLSMWSWVSIIYASSS
jgi:hypothetical protein